MLGRNATIFAEHNWGLTLLGSTQHYHIAVCSLVKSMRLRWTEINVSGWSGIVLHCRGRRSTLSNRESFLFDPFRCQNRCMWLIISSQLGRVQPIQQLWRTCLVHARWKAQQAFGTGASGVSTLKGWPRGTLHHYRDHYPYSENGRSLSCISRYRWTFTRLHRRQAAACDHLILLLIWLMMLL